MLCIFLVANPSTLGAFQFTTVPKPPKSAGPALVLWDASEGCPGINTRMIQQHHNPKHGLETPIIRNNYTYLALLELVKGVGQSLKPPSSQKKISQGTVYFAFCSWEKKALLCQKIKNQDHCRVK